MTILLLLVLFPLLASCIVSRAKTNAPLAWIVRAGAACVLLLSLGMFFTGFRGIIAIDLSGAPWIKYLAAIIGAGLAGYIIYTGIRQKSWLVSLFAAAQLCLALWFEFFSGHSGESGPAVYIDRLSLVMILIVGVIGSLICVFSVEYMKDYQRHHPEVQDRRGFFFAVLFVFLSAMFGLVVTNDLTLLLFCWEITSFCSFLLIGYTKTREAARNSMFALTVNVGGGLAFLIGMVILGVHYGVTGILGFLEIFDGTPLQIIAVLLIATAGLTKSAQMPFSGWLLGAMVAPTPSSAMLHSSTMVKAGVYLILRLAPMLGENAAGFTVTMVGGVTFLTAAILAVAQTDAKKILAYSTVSNLGLIVVCAGIDTAESLWAAIMLIVFHAVAKSLLFCTVGSTEHLLGSRSVEDMDGLYRLSPTLTMLLVIGIAGMFVAPFGMLISKWAAMKAFLDSGNILIVMIVAFGSTLTLFFWTKWMGKLISNAHRERPSSYIMRGDEKVSMFTMAALVIAVCAAYPLISETLVIPYIDSNLHINFVSSISGADQTIIILMLCMLFVLPVVLIPFFRLTKVQRASLYLSGENTGDDKSFRGAMGKTVQTELRNWYMEDFFHVKLTARAGTLVTAGLLIAGAFAAFQGIL